MPYKRKYRKRRKGNLRRVIQSVISKNQETKQIDYSYNAQTIQDNGRTPIVQELSSCNTGTGQNDRIGNQTLVTGMYGQFAVAGADVTNVVRFIIYIPYDTDDVLNVTTFGLVDQDKYTVLMDKIITTTANGPNIKNFKVKLNFKRGGRKGIRCQFDGSSAANTTKNEIKLYVCSDSLAVADPSLSGHIRTYFKDG